MCAFGANERPTPAAAHASATNDQRPREPRHAFPGPNRESADLTDQLAGALQIQLKRRPPPGSPLRPLAWAFLMAHGLLHIITVRHTWHPSMKRSTRSSRPAFARSSKVRAWRLARHYSDNSETGVR